MATAALTKPSTLVYSKPALISRRVPSAQHLTFDALDQDKDGKISKAESVAVPEIERYFDGLDTDRDGFLSREEMQRAMVAAQTAETSTK